MAEPTRARLNAGLSQALRSAAAGCVYVLLEFLVVVAVWRAQFVSAWEIAVGFLWIVPLGLLLSAMLGVAGGLFAQLWLSPRRGQQIGASALLAAALWGMGWGIGGGRHLADPLVRASFGGFLAVLGFAVAFSVRLVLARTPPKWRWLFAVWAALAIAGLEICNHALLVRLYPAFHWALAAFSILLAPLVFWLVAKPQLSRPKFRVAVGVVVLGFGLVFAVRPAARRLTQFDNFRWVLHEKAPIWGKFVQLAALIEAPPQLDTECSTDPACQGRTAAAQTTQGLDWRGKDILLITVDALRADHVSSYGYARKTTPNLDRLGETGAKFEFAYAATPHTSYSLTSLLTGKYMRPLLLLGMGQDSDTWASLLRTYGYKTAAFYPPAVFFIDPERFQPFMESHLGFEYEKVEFAEGEQRVEQISAYLAQIPAEERVFLWTHLFAPHEPYEPHAEFGFGERDLDRYDSEVAFADRTVGQIVDKFRALRPEAVVIVTADHGEEFSEHGGRYHGTTVYEEQVRVPLIVSAPGLAKRSISEPVQSIDLLPTLLSALDIPRPPRIRGRDLSGLWADQKPGPGFAYAETDEQTLIAESSYRLVCARKLGACKLFNLSQDPGQNSDISAMDPEVFTRHKQRLSELAASHGKYEAAQTGSGKAAAILQRARSFDADVTADVVALLDDADLEVRRKAAEALFDLRRPETASALRLALSREEDETVRAYLALALTRLGEGAPLAYELLVSTNLKWQRLSALVLGEGGERRAEKILLAWWQDKAARDFQRSREILDAFAVLRPKDSVWLLAQALEDVRLRPYVARTLAKIGEDSAQGSLLAALLDERFQSTRVALVDALVSLGAEAALAVPLVRYMGVPDPLPSALKYAQRAKILDYVGGPSDKDLWRLRRQTDVGTALYLTVPAGGNGRGVRALVRARSTNKEWGNLWIGPPEGQAWAPEKETSKRVPKLNQNLALKIEVPPSGEMVELYGTLPNQTAARPGTRGRWVIFADHHVQVEALALVPLSDELPPPAPKPWKSTP